MNYIDAMKIRTQAEADAAFEALVAECMKKRPCGRNEAEQIQRSNLGYFSGYYDMETQRRVENFYRCSHPIFGPVDNSKVQTAEQALQLGIQMGRAEAARARKPQK